MKRLVKLIFLLSVVLLLVFTACDIDSLTPFESQEADPIPCTVLAIPNTDSFTSCEDCTSGTSDELRVRVRVDDTTYVFKTDMRIPDEAGVTYYDNTPEHAAIEVDDFSSVSVLVIGTGEVGMERVYAEYVCIDSGTEISAGFNKVVEAPGNSNELCQITLNYRETSDTFINGLNNLCTELVIFAQAFDQDDEPMSIKIRLE